MEDHHDRRHCVFWDGELHQSFVGNQDKEEQGGAEQRERAEGENSCGKVSENPLWEIKFSIGFLL